MGQGGLRVSKPKELRSISSLKNRYTAMLLLLVGEGDGTVTKGSF